MKDSSEGEMRQEKGADQGPKIKCRISTSDANWRSENTGATVAVDIQFQGATELSVMPSLHMIALPKKHGLNQNEYWAPFAIPSGASTKMTQKLSPARETSTRSVRLVPGQLLWAPTMSSVWPAEEFAKTVPQGEYNLQVQLEIKGGKTISSNEVTITVLK
jgi:hypothetical protein